MSFSLRLAAFTKLLILSALTLCFSAEAQTESESPGYLVLQAPVIETGHSSTTWWGQISLQNFRSEGQFNSPRGTQQNFSEASSVLMPRIEFGFSKPWSEELTASVSLGAAIAEQEFKVNTALGSLDSQLTSFIWSVRPALHRKYRNWNLGVLAEAGENRLVQTSSSLNAAENRAVSFMGMGVGLEHIFSAKTSLAANLIARRSNNEGSLKLSPVNLELGVKRQW